MTETGNLRNEDFRKLLAEKVAAGPGETPARGATGPSFSHRAKPAKEEKKKSGGQKHKKPHHQKEKDSDDEDEDLKDILSKYRDRAAERRKHGDTEEDDERLRAAYRAVPGDPRAAADAAEKRRKAIQESKFLGGDMEHTHLVKGLDYSLLNKVRSEIAKTSNEVADDDLDKAFAMKDASEVVKDSDNKMVRSINRTLFKGDVAKRNELFGKGRMAYVVEMEEEDAEIPTTLLRSVYDCPNSESTATVAANNALIQKLTQVLAYLRTDTKKKKKGVEMAEEERAKHKDDNIFDNVGDYAPKRDREEKRERDRDDRERRREDRDRDRDYFERDRRDRDRDRRERRDDHRDRERRERDRDDRDRRDRKDDRREERVEREHEKEREERRREREEKDKAEKEKKLQEKLEKRKKETEGYDECYPGGLAELGGGWDSDEEDFSKMDTNKKGPIKRWDFEHEEDYEKYQGQREAMPKAAYQFGLKTSDGRKTRKTGGNLEKNSEKKLDRELNEINKLMEKRKSGTDGGDAKRPRF